MSNKIPLKMSKFLIFFQEETEDMWHVYNLIAEHDSLRASTFRKVVKESNTGTSQSQKIRVIILNFK